MFRILIALLAFTWPSVSFSEGSTGRFVVEGEVLFFNTYVADKEEEEEIIDEDLEAFKSVLKENPAVKNLTLTSWGGLIGVAKDISDLVIDYGLDTNVMGDCSSACTIIFLGGKNRTVEKGSKVGFHKSNWAAESIENYYAENKAFYGWKSPFEFTEWVHEDSQNDVFMDLEYLVERGVEARFAIKTLNTDSDDMWFPRRSELEAAGVIRVGLE